MRVLLVKMSSLGDVVHALAGVTDAARAIPGIQFDWVVEEAYAGIPAWNPAVNQVIPCALRRWRKSISSALRNGEWGQFIDRLRHDDYDLVLDAQGLLKSALLARRARGLLVGRSFGTAREGAATLFYKRRCKVDLRLTEVEQLRQLFGLALGYPAPETPADFGIDPARLPVVPRSRPYVLFFHGAAWKSKLWSEENWVEIGRVIRSAGLDVLLVWGSQEEQARAERLANEFGGEVLPRLSIAELAGLSSKASFVVGLDTGLTHIAIAVGSRAVTLYGPSVPVYARVAGSELINLTSSDSTVVDTARPNTVTAEAVRHAIQPWIAAARPVP